MTPPDGTQAQTNHTNQPTDQPDHEATDFPEAHEGPADP